MITKLITKEDILKALEDLSPESLAEIWQFTEFLRFKSEERSPRRIIQLRGLWKGYAPITESDVAEARREMWGRLADRAI